MSGSLFDFNIQSMMYKLLFQLLNQDSGIDENTQDSSAITGGFGSARSSYGSSGSPATGKFSDLINQAAEKYNVNPQLINAVIKAESNYNPNAVSKAGAQGLMQLMPGTARSLGVTNSLDPAQNIEGGAKYLSKLLDHYNGNVQLAVAAYNAGPGAVDRSQGIPQYQETQVYVQRVMNYFQSSNQWSG
jgi:soluble lytic murein transglycosylase-like protein